MATKRQIIRLPQGNVPKMAADYGVTVSAVYNALNGNSNSLQAQKMRKEAISLYGGVKTTKVCF